jgi:hypothetical protein
MCGSNYLPEVTSGLSAPGSDILGTAHGAQLLCAQALMRSPMKPLATVHTVEIKDALPRLLVLGTEPDLDRQIAVRRGRQDDEDLVEGARSARRGSPPRPDDIPTRDARPRRPLPAPHRGSWPATRSDSAMCRIEPPKATSCKSTVGRWPHGRVRDPDRAARAGGDCGLLPVGVS